MNYKAELVAAGKLMLEKKLTVETLLSLFTKASGNEFANDRAMLA